MTTLVCWNCGHNLDDVPRPISRHATCSACFNELHCCRLCRHYDPKRTMQCFEDRADPPLQKENANFCDFFTPAAGAHDQRTSSKSSDAKQELDALFAGNDLDEAADADSHPNSEEPEQGSEAVDATPLSKEEQAKKKLDDLFN